MEVKAIAKYVRVQPRKVRIIADEVRGGSAVYVASQLRYHRSKSAHALRKVLISAMANALENHGVAPEQLRVAAITVDEGPKLKRIQARAMGRGARIEKKTSHITVVVADDLEVKPTRKANLAKPRPTFGKGPKKGGTQTVTIPAATTAEAVEETPVVETQVVEEETTAVETPAVETSEDEKGAQ